MSITVEIENTANLKKARTILGAKSNVETLELALERVVEDYEPRSTESEASDLPDSFWDDLFSDPPLPRSQSASQAIIDERNEDRF